MADFNYVGILGRLGKDAFVKNTTDANGQMSYVYGFSVCVNDRKQVNGEWTDVPNWIDCVWTTRQQWSLKKGEKVTLVGKLNQRKFQDPNTGAEISRIRILVDKLEKILIEPKQNQAQPQPAPAQQYQQPAQQYQQAPRSAQPVQPAQQYNAPINDGFDDVPF